MYQQSAELAELGKTIISRHYPYLEPLNIGFVFRIHARIENSRLVVGQTIREPDREFELHGFDVAIEIAKDVWLEATPEYRYALVDHYLGYIGLRHNSRGEPERDESGRFRTYKKRPDVQEFEEVLERHGAYTSDLRSFLRAFADRRKEQIKEEQKAKAAARKAKKKNPETEAAIEEVSTG